MSYRKPAKDLRGNVLTTSDPTVSRRPAPMHPNLPTPKSSTTSESAARTRSPPLKHPSSSTATSSSLAPQRPSGLPRSSSGHSNQRLNALASSRSPPLPSRSPARPQHSRSGSEDVPLILDYNLDLSSLDTHHDTVLGVTMPRKYPTEIQHTLPPRLIPELQALSTQKHSTRPAPSVSTFSSPSTRFTESPAPWSASTATTTPVSWPSNSPAIVQPSQLPGRKSKTVPQPTVPRSRLPKLPTIQQNPSNPKQSQDTEPGDDQSRSREKRAKKKPIVDSPAPTPPPRTSSAQRSGSRGDRSGASSIDETLARAGGNAIPVSRGTDLSPLASRGRGNVDQIGDSLRVFTTEGVHVSLQQSIGAVPSRPSREGTVDLGESRPAVMNSHKAGFSSQHRQLLASAFEDPVPTTLPATSIPQSVSESSLPDSTKVQRSPSRLGKFSRLGLFSRRGTTSASDTDKSPRKLQRRGPAAGTGHEAYGKHGRRTRKVSTESSAVASDSERSVADVARRTPLIGTARKNSISSSRHNRSSQSDLDEFVAPRLKPVIMRGGSQTSISQENEFVQPRQQTRTPDHASRRTSSTSPVVRSPPVPNQPRLRSPKQQIGRSREELRDQIGRMPTLAARRSQRFDPTQEGFLIPRPIRTDGLSAPLLITSYDTSLSSIVPTSAAPSSTGEDFFAVDPSLLRPDDKRHKRAWWNPFKRRDRSIGSPEPVAAPLHQPVGMAVSISAGPAPRSIPYYAMMESESDQTTNEHIGDFLSEAVQSPSHSPVEGPRRIDHSDVAQHSDLMDFPPVPTRPDHVHPYPGDSQLPQLQEHMAKQPRLPQVGRIPKVVSRSERQHVPSRRSFSQPFVKKSTPDDIQQGSPRFLDPHDERPQLEIHTDVLPNRPFHDALNISAKPASAPPGLQDHHVPPADSYFLGPRTGLSKHASDVTTSSSSEGMISVMGPPLFPTHQERDLLERMPKPRIPSMHPGDDEYWNEYDELIDHVMSPSRSPTLRPLPNVPSLQIEAASVIPENTTRRPHSRGRMPVPEPRRAVIDLPLPQVLGSHARVPSPLSLSEKSAIDEIRLRRSRIVSALHSSIDPSSPFSMREFLKDYGPQARDSVGVSDRGSASPGHPPALAPSNQRFNEEPPRAEHTHQENALLIDTVARSKDPLRASELHYASLEVARWLSFGRVLFSPAHHEVHTLPERNVLVIDGLGSEDWSIYCAVNYEAERAIVYDLKETSSYRHPMGQRDSHHLPPNLRRAEVTQLSDRFPFHNAFFSAIVLRFPPAMSEAKMRSIVTECRRTLVPGGHLEVMLLDLDIVNMGVQTRRAVRELKMSMATADPEVSLKPGIDNFQDILGGRGFTGLNRCVVGVPVVGRPAAGSMDSSSSSRSSRGSGGHIQRMSGSPTQSSFNKHHGHKFSLNELVADHSEKADAKIGRTVSACARSWWQHCYEATIIPDGDLSRSIFADKRVLQECKSRASSFKLLIAHAQRPVFETRRRTMSESAASNLAVAGPPRRPKALIE